MPVKQDNHCVICSKDSSRLWGAPIQVIFPTGLFCDGDEGLFCTFQCASIWFSQWLPFFKENETEDSVKLTKRIIKDAD